jgi:hypothetical protein
MKPTIAASAAGGMGAAALTWGTPVFIPVLVMAVVFAVLLTVYNPSPIPLYHICAGEILAVIAGQVSIAATAIAQAGVIALAAGSTVPSGDQVAGATILVPLIVVMAMALLLSMNISVTVLLIAISCIGAAAVFGLRAAEYRAVHAGSDQQ